MHRHDPPLFSTFASTSTSPPPFHHSSQDLSSFLATQSPTLLQKTTSSLSFHDLTVGGFSNYSFPMLENTSMRRVFSTGDMDPLRGDGDGVVTTTTTGPMGGRVGRYNAEERRERIERYRSKRNHRNFQKKITYACRKTLADSRPRVRGRFARNGELEAEQESMAFYNNGGGEMNNGFYHCNGFAPTMSPDYREEDEYGYDGELWTSFLDVFATNNLVSE